MFSLYGTANYASSFHYTANEAAILIYVYNSLNIFFVLDAFAEEWVVNVGGIFLGGLN